MNGLKLSLYEDWAQRRKELDNVPDSPVYGYRSAHIRILDYLITRYVDDPHAQNPALFPMKSGVVMNQRATLVHAHLLGRPTTQTMDDATDRMSPILKRMAAQKAQESVDAPAAGKAATLPNVLGAITGLPSVKLMNLVFATKESAAIQHGWDCLEQGGKMLPDDVIQVLCRNLYDRRVTPILKRCANQSAVVYCGEAWLLGENVAAAEAVLIESHHQPVALGFMREKLAHHHSLTRRRATRMIGMIGTLDDISLLMDLHALPPQYDETPIEREQLAAAIAAITARKENETRVESTGIQTLFR